MLYISSIFVNSICAWWIFMNVKQHVQLLQGQSAACKLMNGQGYAKKLGNQPE